MEQAELAVHAKAVSAGLGLTPTQALIAIGIWRGLREHQVAGWLGRSKDTVRCHLRAIYPLIASHGLARSHVGIALAVERVITAYGAIVGI